MSKHTSSTWADRANYVVFVLATVVGAWIGVLYLISPHATEVGLPRHGHVE